MITNQGSHASLVGTLSFLLSLSVKSIEEEIQPSINRVDNPRG